MVAEARHEIGLKSAVSAVDGGATARHGRMGLAGRGRLEHAAGSGLAHAAPRTLQRTETPIPEIWQKKRV